MTGLRLLAVYFRLGALNELQYRVNFVVQLFQTAIGLATSLAGLGLVFSHTARLGGWTGAEIVVLLGVFFVVGGLINVLVAPSMQKLMEDVRLGTLDFTLTKPRDAQLLISIREVQIWKLVDVAMGVAVLVIGLTAVSASIGVIQAAEFGATLVAGAAIVYSFWVVLAVCSFWFVRVDNVLVVFQSMYEAGRWPVSLYPPWLRAAVTFLVPVAFAVTIPAEAITGRLSPLGLTESLGLAVLFLAGSRWFWTWGVRHYTGASA